MVRSSRINRKVRGTRRRSSRGRSRVSKAADAGLGLGAGAGMTLGLIGSLVGAAALDQGSDDGASQEPQNQNVMSGGKRGRGNSRDAGDLILRFMEMLNTIKIYHWSTLSYPTHKATDKLHEKMSELVDSFIEIYIGHLARRGNAGVPEFKKGGSGIPFYECSSIEMFCKKLDGYISFMEGLTERLNGYTDLVNIRDEMVGAAAHALYLLRLK